MREVRVSGPAGCARAVVETAREAGISGVTVYEAQGFDPDEPREVVSTETSTPASKRFVEALTAAAYFDPLRYTITTRDLRSVISHESVRSVTVPIAAPEPDVIEELWQSGHITRAYVGRIALASVLLAYAMIHNTLLLMIAALLFTPFLSHALAIGLGSWTRQWRLAAQGAYALALGAAIGVASGWTVGMLTDAPFRFEGFAALPVSVLISAAIGGAAGLATVDDAGRRAFLGLAAASQFAIYPVWFGIFLARGFGETSAVSTRLETVGLNVLAIIAASTIAYAVTGERRLRMRASSPERHAVPGKDQAPAGTGGR